MSAEEEAYHEVSAYTLTHGDRTFIHQHVVDAWAAYAESPDGVIELLRGRGIVRRDTPPNERCS